VDPAAAPASAPAAQSPAGAGGSVREVTWLATPVVLSMMSETMMHVVDTIFVGRLGTAEQGAVGVAATVSWTLFSFIAGILHAVQIFVAQHVGARSPRGAGEVTWQGIYLALVAAIPITVVGFTGGSIFRILGMDPLLVPHAMVYFQIRLLGAVVVFLAFTGESYLRGVGDTRTPMVVTFVANGTNILLDYLLIFGHLGFPRLGVAGAAWATVAAVSLQATILLVAFERRGRRDGHLVRPVLPPVGSAFLKLVRVGLPVGVQWVLEMGSWTIFTVFAAQLGKVQAAAHQVATVIIHVSFMPGYGVSVAATTLVGQYLGAGDRQSALASARNALRLAMTFMGAMGLVFFLARYQLVRIFNVDPEVVALGGQLLLFAALFQVFDAANMVLSGILRGAGDTRFPMLATIVMSWLVFVPLAWLLTMRLGYGVAGGWLAAVVWIFGQALVLRHRYVRRRWMEKTLVRIEIEQ
jgi:MATE family multidrug resistance protein